MNRQRFALLAILTQGIPQIAERLNVVRAVTYGVTIAGDSCGTLAACHQQQAKVVVRLAESRVQLERPAGTAHGFLELTQLPERISQIAQYLRVIWFQPERAPVPADGLCRLTQLQEYIAQIVVGVTP